MESVSRALRTSARAVALAAILGLSARSAAAQQPGGESTSDLAKKKENPVSDLAQIPMEIDVSYKTGVFDRTASSWNFQPIWPVKLSETWNLIPRMVIPLIDLPIGPSDRTFGLGDSTLALFLSPQEPASVGNAGIVWGAGPLVLIPTSSNSSLGLGEWGVGPTAAMVATGGPWVGTALAQNVWSINGAVDQFLFQGIVNYNFDSGLSLTLGTDVNADWKEASNRRWTVDLGPGVSQTFFLGKQAMSASVSARPFIVRPALTPAWVLQISLSVLFPK